MKSFFVSCILFLALAAAGFASPTVALTGNVAADFETFPTPEQALNEFTTNPQPLWGFGWEVVGRKVGIGGVYMVKFFDDAAGGWAMDWYGQGLILSFHLFGGGAFLDPFLEAGAGCAGRVVLSGPAGADPLYLSIFPFIGGGLALDFDGFTVGAKMGLVPFQTGIPFTAIPEYPVGRFQVQVYTGITLGR